MRAATLSLSLLPARAIWPTRSGIFQSRSRTPVSANPRSCMLSASGVLLDKYILVKGERWDKTVETDWHSCPTLDSPAAIHFALGRSDRGVSLSCERNFRTFSRRTWSGCPRDVPLQRYLNVHDQLVRPPMPWVKRKADTSPAACPPSRPGRSA